MIKIETAGHEPAFVKSIREAKTMSANGKELGTLTRRDLVKSTGNDDLALSKDSDQLRAASVSSDDEVHRLLERVADLEGDQRKVRFEQDRQASISTRAMGLAENAEIQSLAVLAMNDPKVTPADFTEKCHKILGDQSKKNDEAERDMYMHLRGSRSASRESFDRHIQKGFASLVGGEKISDDDGIFQQSGAELKMSMSIFNQIGPQFNRFRGAAYEASDAAAGQEATANQTGPLIPGGGLAQDELSMLGVIRLNLTGSSIKIPVFSDVAASLDRPAEGAESAEPTPTPITSIQSSSRRTVASARITKEFMSQTSGEAANFILSEVYNRLVGQISADLFTYSETGIPNERQGLFHANSPVSSIAAGGANTGGALTRQLIERAASEVIEVSKRRALGYEAMRAVLTPRWYMRLTTIPAVGTDGAGAPAVNDNGRLLSVVPAFMSVNIPSDLSKGTGTNFTGAVIGTFRYTFVITYGGWVTFRIVDSDEHNVRRGTEYIQASVESDHVHAGTNYLRVFKDLTQPV